MMVTSKGRYALHVMVDIAKNEGDGYVSVSDIADREHLSLKYIETIIAMLNKGGLVKSLRGKNGGYRLARDPADYKISEILRLAEGSLAPVECVKGNDGCANASNCTALPLWKGLDRTIENYLEGITLEDVAEGRLPR